MRTAPIECRPEAAILNQDLIREKGLDHNVFINDFDGLVVSSTHGSPWRYDTFVPVIFAGAGLQSKSISREITPYDIAPTLAGYLGVKPPSGASGNPLPEVLGN